MARIRRRYQNEKMERYSRARAYVRAHRYIRPCESNRRGARASLRYSFDLLDNSKAQSSKRNAEARIRIRIVMKVKRKGFRNFAEFLFLCLLKNPHPHFIAHFLRFNQRLIVFFI